MKSDGIKYTEGSILKSIWRLGWPAVTSMLLETMLSITDAYWVGKLGAAEMAAVTSSMFPMWTVFSMLTIIPTGLVAIISRAVGAEQTEKVSRTARQGIQLSIYVGIAYAIFGYWATPYVFDLMGTEEAVSQMGISYLRIFFIGVVFFFLNDTFAGLFRALGDTKAQLIGTISAVVINIALDPILIFGLGPFPAWGTDGASIATLVAVLCGTTVYLVMIKRGRLGFKLGFNIREKIDFKLARAIMIIGAPPATSSMVFSIVYIFLNRIVAEYGTVSIAALMVGNRMESLSFLTCFGFSLAASTMVGQNLGAGRPDRAAKSVWAAFGICAVYTTIISIIFLVFPRELARFFITDEAVVSIAIEYLRILALSQIFMAAEIVLDGAFAGAGNTVPPMAISIPGTIARIPLAYYLCFEVGLGISGVWWTLTITTWIRGLVIMYWFSRGRWKKTGLMKTT